MNSGQFNLFLKMIRDEYKLADEEVLILARRMLADSNEFEKIWKLYKNKAQRFAGGVDDFKAILQELLA